MITITRTGALGPVEALELRNELTRAAITNDREVTLDLTEVSTLHPAVAAAIVHGAQRFRSEASTFHLIEPTHAAALRTLSLISLVTLIR